jgi:hypothetical protein
MVLDQMLDKCDFHDIQDPKSTSTRISSNSPAFQQSEQEVPPYGLQVPPHVTSLQGWMEEDPEDG